MLGMKAWLETRWRLLFVFAIPLFALAARYGGLASKEDVRRLLGSLSAFSMFAATFLAGTGIKTQAALRQTKGAHGSLYFTLSLPVSRFRLLVARTSVGLLEFAGFNVVIYGVAWIFFPLVRGDSKPIDLLELILAAIVCCVSFYFMSVLSATVLDDVWQIWGNVLLFAAMQWINSQLHLPASWTLTGFAGDSSPLLTHQLPWTAMAISVCLAGILFSAALKVVQTREY
jgi:hypothetical protein